ncbi:MAG: sugar phosphate isomerase/epimerase family protein [Candidatus Methanosuratincola sp.]|jgi:sugar phosphate isomerase/epimerase|nr:sugar phosphate isomerase/epimerase family protein [Candidatus Methanosuratincola sp.]
MPIGISTLCTFGETFKKIGFYRESTPPVIEVIDDWADRLDGSRIRILLDLASVGDVRFTVHAPIIDLNIASANERLKRLSAQLVKESIDHARDLGALLVVVHPGSFPPDGRGDPEAHWRLNSESFCEIREHAAREGVGVCLENMPAGTRLFFQTPQEFLRASEEGLDFGVALDVGHANTRGMLGEFLELLRGRIRHLHLHDNKGDRDAHLPVGRGTVDWQLLKREIDISSLTAVVEANTELEALESVAAARQLFSS